MPIKPCPPPRRSERLKHRPTHDACGVMSSTQSMRWSSSGRGAPPPSPGPQPYPGQRPSSSRPTATGSERPGHTVRQAPPLGATHTGYSEQSGELTECGLGERAQPISPPQRPPPALFAPPTTTGLRPARRRAACRETHAARSPGSSLRRASSAAGRGGCQERSGADCWEKKAWGRGKPSHHRLPPRARLDWLRSWSEFWMLRLGADGLAAGDALLGSRLSPSSRCSGRGPKLTPPLTLTLMVAAAAQGRPAGDKISRVPPDTCTTWNHSARRPCAAPPRRGPSGTAVAPRMGPVPAA